MAGPGRGEERENGSIPATLIQSIKQLLGQHINIISHKRHSIITPDNEVIVDVNYNVIPFDQYNIYFIDKSDIKQLLPNTDKYVFSINECNVKLSSSTLNNFKKYVPVHIFTTLSNNYSTSGQLENQFCYFALIVNEPMHNLITPLSMSFKPNPIKALYPKDFKPQVEEINENTLRSNYKNELTNISILSFVDNVVIAKSFQETSSNTSTTAFIIDFNKIPRDKSINGIILIISERKPFHVLYYPIKTFIITVEQLNSINEFLKNDYINYLNYQYMMNN